MVLLIWISCQNSIEPSTLRVVYFDMKQFIQDEIVALNKETRSLKKIIYTKDSTDTLIILKPDWQKELHIFTTSNINKPTLYETYSVDTSNNIIQYKSLKSKNKVEYLTLTYSTAQLKTIEKITINNRQENFINRSTEVLTYLPQKNYTIEIQQNVISNKNNTIKLFGEIYTEE